MTAIDLHRGQLGLTKDLHLLRELIPLEKDVERGQVPDQMLLALAQLWTLSHVEDDLDREPVVIPGSKHGH